MMRPRKTAERRYNTRGAVSPFEHTEAGLLRIDRESVYCQVLLNLSDDPEHPTKSGSLVVRVRGWSKPHIHNALNELIRRGMVERVDHGLYVRRWAPLPEAVS